MAERRYSILLYTAVVTAAVATFGVYRVLQSTKSKNQVPTTAVAVAVKDLPEGSSLTAANVQVKQWPTPTVPEGAYPGLDSLVGRVTKVPVYAGEPIVPGRLAPTGQAPGLEVKVPAGKRAMAVKINDVAGISGLIQPNSRVDVVVTMRPTQDSPTPVSKVFIENLRVLSVGTTVQRDADGKAINATTAALEVTPDEAERLAIAANEGSIQLALRGFGDPQSVATKGARARDVLGMPEPAPAPKAVAATPAPKPKRRQSAGGDVAPQVVQQAAPVVVTVTAPPPPPKPAPETLTVTIYRGGQVERRAFVKPDTGRKP